MSKVYKINQISDILKVSPATVKKLIKEKKIKAFKTSMGYIINEISLNVFLGKKIEDCINIDEFESNCKETNKLYDGKVDKEKFYKYYCSLFMPGDELTRDDFLIKDQPLQVPITNEDTAPNRKEINQVSLTKEDIAVIVECLNKIQQVLLNKIR